MTDWPDAINRAWDEIAKTPPVSRQFRSRLISTDVLLEVRAGMRAVDNAPCLMLQATLAADALFEVGGMRLAAIPDDTGQLLVLSLEEPTRRDLFLTICADVVGAAAVVGKGDALRQFLARLDAWRKFLRDRQDGLSRPETIGLIGELIVLEQILAANPYRLESWQSPNDGLHDFLIGGCALEVKSTLGPASIITISKLDQLDTTSLRRLDLLHVTMVESPHGRSLRDIISSISDTIPDDSSRRAFGNSLLRRGLMPNDDVARDIPKAQLRTIDAYTVSDGFPRLVRSTLPVAIAEATYMLEVRAISSFATDTPAVLQAFLNGDQT